MKYLIIHNRYSRTGGEECMVDFQCELLRRAGHDVHLYQRDYAEMSSWRLGRLSRLFSAIYNGKSVREVRKITSTFKPEVAIIHNLFPVISPAILPVLNRGGVRILMSVHNFRLICPTGLFYTAGGLCEKCGSGCREWNCLRLKCEGTIAGSFAYALRGWWSRINGAYLRNVDRFLVQSEFHADKLASYGIDKQQMAIVHNCLSINTMPHPTITDRGDYVAFVGRLSPEKGVDLLFAVARLLPGVRFCVAGETAEGMLLEGVPKNIELRGFLDRQQLADFYSGAAVTVMTSRVYEGGITLTLLEAMYYSCAVVAQNIGAATQTLENGRCGLLSEYGSAADMARCVSMLLSDKTQRHALGERGHDKVVSEYNDAVYLAGLTENSF